MRRSDLAHLKYSLIRIKGLSVTEADKRIQEVIKAEHCKQKQKVSAKPTFQEEFKKLKGVKHEILPHHK